MSDAARASSRSGEGFRFDAAIAEVPYAAGRHHFPDEVAAGCPAWRTAVWRYAFIGEMLLAACPNTH
jgi:hypothetical protein